MNGAHIIVGSQWGDEGKGLISAYFAKRENAKYTCRAGTGPNAEHGVFLHDEQTYLKTNQLPLGWMFNPNTEIRIGSGVAVDPVKLFAEIEKYHLHGRVKVDFRSPIVTQEHIRAEETSSAMKSIGSTFSGTGLARADFVLRKAKQARDIPELKDMLTDTSKDINGACKHGENVIIESSQGTFLSLALSPDYPNVTSDNVTAMAAADDVLLNWKYLKEVILVVKALPTREGNGSMGAVAEMSVTDMKAQGMAEISSIGGAVRRKAVSLDWDMLKDAVEVNGATQIALTFLDHYDSDMNNVTDKGSITKKTWSFIHEVETATGVPVTVLNTGKAFDRLIDLTRPTATVSISQ